MSVRPRRRSSSEVCEREKREGGLLSQELVFDGDVSFKKVF
jgi:hypothetical protein